MARKSLRFRRLSVLVLILCLSVLSCCLFNESISTKKLIGSFKVYNTPTKDNHNSKLFYDQKDNKEFKNSLNMDKQEISPIQNLFNLQNQYCCFGFSPKEKENLKKCDLCAVVTSSGHLLGSSAGEEIDKADCVMRINVSPTKGYEKDVGNKTTLRYIAGLSAEYLLEHPKWLSNDSIGTQAIVYPMDSHVLEKIYKLFPKINIYCLKKEWMNKAAKTFRDMSTYFPSELSPGAWPSTGYKALIVAQQLCLKIIVYGISSPLHCKRLEEKKDAAPDVPYHYYDPPAKNNKSAFGQNECFNFNKWDNIMKTTNLSKHDVIMEKYIYSLWAKEGIKITFRFPHWTHKEITDLYDDF